MISGTFYQNDIKGALQMFGPMSVTEIKEKLKMRNIFLDDVQILDCLELLLRTKAIQKSDISGKYVKRSLY